MRERLARLPQFGGNIRRSYEHGMVDPTPIRGFLRARSTRPAFNPPFCSLMLIVDEVQHCQDWRLEQPLHDQARPGRATRCGGRPRPEQVERVPWAEQLVQQKRRNATVGIIIAKTLSLL